MNHIIKKHWLKKTVSISVLAMLSSTHVNAQSNSEMDGVEEVVVTATKTNVDILEVPAAVGVVTQEKIEKQGARTVIEALQGEPAVRVSWYTEGNFPIVQIRSSGDAGQFQNNDILVLIDGIPQVNLNDQSYYDQVPFEAIERIEVVRGPTSALYGRNAVGGTINIITRDAPEETEVSATLAAGSFGFLKPRLTLGGAVSDSVNVLVSGSYETSDGWRDQAERDAVDLFARADISLGERTRLTLTGQYFDLEQETPTILPLLPDASEVPGVDFEDSHNLPGAESRNESLQFAAVLKHSFSDALAVTVPVYFRETDRVLNRDGSFIDNIDTVAQTYDLYPFSPTSEDSIYGLNPQVVWQASDTVEFVGGVDYEKNDGKGGASNTFPAGTNFFTPITVNYITGEFQTDLNNLEELVRRDGDFESEVFAVYAQARIDLTEQLRLTLGGRYDTQDRELNDPLRPNSNVSADYNQFTPRVSLDYSFNDNLHGYVSYSEGFNPPFGGAFAFERAGADELDPEIATNYEIGLKTRFADGRGYANVAAFMLEREDLVQVIRIGGVNTQQNAGGLDVWGIEVDAAFELGSGFELSGNYSYTDTEWQAFTVSGVSFAGFEVTQTPEHLASVALDWSSSDGRFEIGTFIDYVGERYADRPNTVELDSYTLVNLQAAFRPHGDDRLTVRAQVFNLFDEEYFSRTELDFLGRVLGGAPGLPVSFQASVSFRF